MEAVAVTKDHKLRGLKRVQWILWRFWRPEVQDGVRWAQDLVLTGLHPLWHSLHTQGPSRLFQRPELLFLHVVACGLFFRLPSQQLSGFKSPSRFRLW